VPGRDEHNSGVKVPEFFQVPFDNGSHCSYWSSGSGRSRGLGWFRSAAYDTCQQELKKLQEWRLQQAAGSSGQAAGTSAGTSAAQPADAVRSSKRDSTGKAKVAKRLGKL
jgi:hypothetical protein